MKRMLAVAVLGVMLLGSWGNDADAGRWSWSVSVGTGCVVPAPCYPATVVYPQPVYYPQTVYYPQPVYCPPTVVYAPPPVVYYSVPRYYWPSFSFSAGRRYGPVYQPGRPAYNAGHHRGYRVSPQHGHRRRR